MTEFSNILESYLVPILEQETDNRHPFIQTCVWLPDTKLEDALTKLQEKNPRALNAEVNLRKRTVNKIRTVLKELEREIKPSAKDYNFYISANTRGGESFLQNDPMFLYSAGPMPMASKRNINMVNWYTEYMFCVYAVTVKKKSGFPYKSLIQDPQLEKIREFIMPKIADDPCIHSAGWYVERKKCIYKQNESYPDSLSDFMIILKPSDKFSAELKECGYDLSIRERY